MTKGKVLAMLSAFLLLLSISVIAMAQEADSVSVNDMLNNEGGIYDIPRADGNITLEKLQVLINASGAEWTVRETSVSGIVSKMSPKEKEKFLNGVDMSFQNITVKGTVYSEKVSRETGMAISSLEQEELPEVFDWRDKDGQNWMTPVKDQGVCGSCWAFSVIGTVEAATKIYANNSALEIDLAEQYLVSDCFEKGDCDGGSMVPTLEHLKIYGVPDEACVPYLENDSFCDPCFMWEERALMVRDYVRVDSSTELFKRALLEHGPMSVLVNTGEDWCYYAGGIYEQVWPSVDDGKYTSHLVVLTGWNDSERCWIIKNSWGESWGENGYGKVLFGTLEKYNYAFAVTGVVEPRKNLARIEPERVYNILPNNEVIGREILTVRNNGGGTLEYEISIDNETDWLSVDVSTGIIPARTCDNISIFFSPDGLEDGSYRSNISIKTNDPGNQMTVIPVDLLVGLKNIRPSVDITVSQESGYSPLEVSLFGGGNDPDGRIVSYKWSVNNWCEQKNLVMILRNSEYLDGDTMRTIWLTVTDNFGATNSTQVEITVKKQPERLNASIIAYPLVGKAPLEVNFFGDVTGSQGKILDWCWYWYFNTESSWMREMIHEPNASHIFPFEGVYSVTLNATDNFGEKGSDNITINVIGRKDGELNVSLLASPKIGEAPLDVSLSAVVEEENKGIRYYWSFEKDYGVFPFYRWANLRCVYDEPGEYNARIMVMNETTGEFGYANTTISVLDPDRPTVSIVTWATTGEAPFSVDFFAKIVNPFGREIVLYEWDFGDGTKEEGEVVRHLFPDIGAYNIILIVTDDQGATGLDTMVIGVTDPSPNNS